MEFITMVSLMFREKLADAGEEPSIPEDISGPPPRTVPEAVELNPEEITSPSPRIVPESVELIPDDIVEPSPRIVGIPSPQRTTQE